MLAASASDLLILLLADDVSPTVRAEIRAALASRAPFVILAKQGPSMTAPCRRLVGALAKKGFPALAFRNASELRTHVIQALQRHVLNAVHVWRRP
jgi:hypothetical protein